MFFRVFGLLIALVGFAAFAFGGYGYLDTDSTAKYYAESASRQSMAFDVFDWSIHWKVYSAIFSLAGLIVFVSGVVMALRRKWGLLVLAIGLAFTAMCPWALAALGWIRYGYEKPGAGESAFFAVLALTAVLAFGFGRQRRVGT